MKLQGRGSTPRPGPRRLLGLELRRLAGPGLPEGLPAAPLARALRDAVRHRRGQLDLLPARQAEAVARWIEQVPEGFVFALKASQYMTHMKRLRRHRSTARALLRRDRAAAESPKLGPVLWQLPESFHRDVDAARERRSTLPPGRYAFEFRHPSWFAGEVIDAARARVALVIGDHPRAAVARLELTTDWTFVRFHFGARGRLGNYSDRELREWARAGRRAEPGAATSTSTSTTTGRATR